MLIFRLLIGCFFLAIATPMLARIAQVVDYSGWVVLCYASIEAIGLTLVILHCT